MQRTKIDIGICMGSSCFSRGNNKTLGVIQAYMEDHALEGSIDLTGALCAGKCNTGPNIAVNGVSYERVYTESVIDILDHHRKQMAEESETERV